ncbi:hypothetical protein AVEN_232785-1 [Araneus ventricosus]|uniref:Uncharacterized protein n=1 Tax=Araneus ventricosus TaxID=182803 RepID=A0A4Y2MZI8_ARAVE|nr:hypothetical protein AVEN_232785-1 [Araneus ventricosus]
MFGYRWRRLIGLLAQLLASAGLLFVNESVLGGDLEKRAANGSRHPVAVVVRVALSKVGPLCGRRTAVGELKGKRTLGMRFFWNSIDALILGL